MLVTKLLLGRQIDQIAMVQRGRRGVGQKNLVNTDKILLFKHTPFIPISLQAPLSLQSFLAYASPSLLKAPFQTQYLFSRVSPCCCAAFIFCFSLPLFPCLHPKSSACCHLFLPFQTSWLWFIYPPDPSHSQHPLGNG